MKKMCVFALAAMSLSGSIYAAQPEHKISYVKILKLIQQGKIPVITRSQKLTLIDIIAWDKALQKATQTWLKADKHPDYHPLGDEEKAQLDADIKRLEGRIEAGLAQLGLRYIANARKLARWIESGQIVVR